MNVTTTYSDWHTLTIEPDGENDDGSPLMDYTLAHPDSCAHHSEPEDAAGLPEFVPAYECWLAELVGEFSDCPDYIGLPTEPGTYRLRAWGTAGDWSGPHYIEPDSGIDISEARDPNDGEQQ